MHRMSGRNDVIKIVTETETTVKVTKESAPLPPAISGSFDKY